ncbi:MAG: AsnC family transcriptional regulator [Methylococcales bacterium]|nr:AsnC family transcriptional regulator [Methylococcales bacterium]
MDEVDRKIINYLQLGFPVCESPYQLVATELGLTESGLIKRIEKLLKTGILSRFGPLYHAEQMGGALTLAAVKAPTERFEQIAEIINSFPEVAHNYARNHQLNMWFVIATDTPERIAEVISEIEEITGLTVYNMPKINEYFVGLKLEA